MKILITRPCFVAGENRVVDEVLECDAAHAGPTLGANRAVFAAEDAKVGRPPKRGRPANTEIAQ